MSSIQSSSLLVSTIQYSSFLVLICPWILHRTAGLGVRQWVLLIVLTASSIASSSSQAANLLIPDDNTVCLLQGCPSCLLYGVGDGTYIPDSNLKLIQAARRPDNSSHSRIGHRIFKKIFLLLPFLVQIWNRYPK